MMAALFLGCATFFLFLLAVVIGGEAAAMLCLIVDRVIIPAATVLTSCSILLGLLVMYAAGEKALTVKKEEASCQK